MVHYIVNFVHVGLFELIKVALASLEQNTKNIFKEDRPTNYLFQMILIEL